MLRSFFSEDTINPSNLKYTLGDLENPHNEDLVAVFFDRDEKKVIVDESGNFPALVVSNKENEIFKIQGISHGFFENHTDLINYDIDKDGLEGIDVFRIISEDRQDDLGLLPNRKLEEKYFYKINTDNLLDGLKRMQKEDQESPVLAKIREQCRSYDAESFCSEGEKLIALSFPEGGLKQQQGYEEHDGRIGVVCKDSEFNLNQKIQLKNRNSDLLVDIVIVGKNLSPVHCKYNNLSRIQTTGVVKEELKLYTTDDKGYSTDVLYVPNNPDAKPDQAPVR